MPSTYSINVGQPTEATRKQDIYTVLQDIPDNTSKLISPRDVRDAILSTWANSSFRQTIGTPSVEYIGIDSGDPSNRDIKQKILIGKRNIAGVDVMNNLLLSDPNTDIFFYNTKPDSSLTQSQTRISILAGTDSTLHSQSVYIQSRVTGTSSEVNQLDFVNPSLYGGPINLYSTLGRVSINGIIFPTVEESFASASNGRILRYKGTYPFGSLAWDDSNVSLANIGSTGSPTVILGSPVTINGFPLELTDSTPVPQTIGGITQGTTFSSVPLIEVVERLLYPYIEPVLYLSVTNLTSGSTYAEIGTTASSILSYSLTRMSNDISTYSISGTTYSGLSFSALPGSIISATISAPTYSAWPSLGPKTWILSVSDNYPFMLASYSATASVDFIYPVMHGFSTIIAVFLTAPGLCSVLGRSSIPQPGASSSIFINYSGGGFFYFIHHNSWTQDIKYIKDPNGYIIHDYNNWGSSFFTYSVISTFITPTGGGIGYTSSFRYWHTTATCSYPGGDFEFIY